MISWCGKCEVYFANNGEDHWCPESQLGLRKEEREMKCGIGSTVLYNDGGTWRPLVVTGRAVAGDRTYLNGYLVPTPDLPARTVTSVFRGLASGEYQRDEATLEAAQRAADQEVLRATKGQ